MSKIRHARCPRCQDRHHEAAWCAGAADAARDGETLLDFLRSDGPLVPSFLGPPMDGPATTNTPVAAAPRLDQLDAEPLERARPDRELTCGWGFVVRRLEEKP